jgi:precorrin-6Y C5,15-methyltransferase (decarboxylating)
MTTPIVIVGIGLDGPAGLRRDVLEMVQTADFLAGGRRHLDFFPGFRGERFILKDNLPELTAVLRRRAGQRCVVLASGDPLFYGIGKYLSEQFSPTALRIEPAISAMQLAFARAGLSWQDAALASVHGRDLRTVLLPLLGQRTIGLFTDERNGPAAVARFFREHGPEDYQGFVGENLGDAEERLSGWLPLPDLAQRSFASLSYLVLRRTADTGQLAEVARRRGLVPGAPDEEFLRPADGPEVMTRREVRAALLGKLAAVLGPGDIAWDIGAGLGTVSVELAVLRPGSEIIAVERDTSRAELLRQNRERFGSYNVRVLHGEAPGVLHGESGQPRAIFLGGSGGRLEDILDYGASRLSAGGVLLAALVTLEHLTQMLQRVKTWGWPLEVTELQVARSDQLGGLTGLKPLRGVFLIETRPARSASDGEIHRFAKR